VAVLGVLTGLWPAVVSAALSFLLVRVLQGVDMHVLRRSH
jgi:hypothetical protein